MIMRIWDKLKEILQLEGPEDEMGDDELDALTSPQKSFANPFDPPAKTTAKVNTPDTKMKIGANKPAMAPPAPKNMFGEPVNPNDFRSGGTGVAKGRGLAKPPYKGSFVGQVWDTNAGVSNKRVSWKDLEGNWRGKNIQQQQKTQMVWDGTDWVTPDVFLMKAKQGKLKKESALSQLFSKLFS